MDIFLDNIKNVSVIVLTAYPLTWYSGIQRALSRVATGSDAIGLTLLFGMLTICGNLITTEVFNQAILNSGLLGPTVGGIIAGPIVGIMAGIIGGLHRLSMGGFTMTPDLCATILGGILGGIFHCQAKRKCMTYTYALLAGILVSILNNLLILFLAEPRILAVTFIRWTGMASIFATGMGTGIFISIVQSAQDRQYSIGTNYAAKATEIAQEALAVIKGDLNADVAQRLVEMIDSSAIADAVAISDGECILAFAGQGCETHYPGSRDITLTKGFADNMEEARVANSKVELGCSIPHCLHDAVVIAPLRCGNEQIWFLHVYRNRDVIHPPDIKLVTGIANLLSLQIHNNRLQNQAKLLAQAEYAALRSQINPHFLFNALSVIKLQIREDPLRAQKLLLELASFFRRTLEVTEDMIPLSEELKCVEFYINIQQSRFGNRLHVEYDIPPECMSLCVPSFVIQPLVENCFNHGFSSNGDRLNIKIVGHVLKNGFTIFIEDNGNGIPPEILEAVKSDKVTRRMGVGLTNIKRRLKSIYGRQCTFYLENCHPGAIVGFSIETEDTA